MRRGPPRGPEVHEALDVVTTLFVADHLRTRGRLVTSTTSRASMLSVASEDLGPSPKAPSTSNVARAFELGVSAGLHEGYESRGEVLDLVANAVLGVEELSRSSGTSRCRGSRQESDGDDDPLVGEGVPLAVEADRQFARDLGKWCG